jgi:hypothetical protein
MDDESKIKIIRLIVRLTLFSLLCFFIFSFVRSEKPKNFFKYLSSAWPFKQKTKINLLKPDNPNIIPAEEPIKAEDEVAINNLMPLEEETEKSKPKKEPIKTKEPQVKKPKKPSKEKIIPLLIPKTSEKPKVNAQPMPESVKVFKDELRKKYRINNLALSYASSLGLTIGQTTNLFRQIVNLNENNFCSAWKVKRNLLAVCKNNSATFEETGHFAINAQLMPCLNELKNKEKMLNTKYSTFNKINFLLNCY